MAGKPASKQPGSSHRLPNDRVSLEKRSDGAVVVRVSSESVDSAKLPDAVFAFRVGDPQYAYWMSRLESASVEE